MSIVGCSGNTTVVRRMGSSPRSHPSLTDHSLRTGDSRGIYLPSPPPRHKMVPMKKPRRATLVLWIVVVAIALVMTSLWVDEGPLWRWANYKTIILRPDSSTVPDVGHPLQGLAIVSRWR